MSYMKREFERDNPTEFEIPQGLGDRLSEDDMNSEIEQSQFFDRVEEEMEAIIREEGLVHVAGLYYASQWDAQCQRQWLAESRVRESARQREIRLRSEMKGAA